MTSPQEQPTSGDAGPPSMHEVRLAFLEKAYEHTCDVSLASTTAEDLQCPTEIRAAVNATLMDLMASGVEEDLAKRACRDFIARRLRLSARALHRLFQQRRQKLTGSATVVPRPALGVVNGVRRNTILESIRTTAGHRGQAQARPSPAPATAATPADTMARKAERDGLALLKAQRRRALIGQLCLLLEEQTSLQPTCTSPTPQEQARLAKGLSVYAQALSVLLDPPSIHTRDESTPHSPNLRRLLGVLRSVYGNMAVLHDLCLEFDIADYVKPARASASVPALGRRIRRSNSFEEKLSGKRKRPSLKKATTWSPADGRPAWKSNSTGMFAKAGSRRSAISSASLVTVQLPTRRPVHKRRKLA